MILLNLISKPRPWVLSFLFFLMSLTQAVSASLSYEFHCNPVTTEQESSTLKIAISPDGADLMSLVSEGEVDEAYHRTEVSQFKFIAANLELFLFVKAAQDKSGPRFFEINVKTTGSKNICGKYRTLTLEDLLFKEVFATDYCCTLVE